MNYISFNDHHISNLGLGTVQFGLNYGINNLYGQPTMPTSLKIGNLVYNHGINCFDTAITYGDSQKILAKILNNKKDIFIISKLSSHMFIDNFFGSIQNIQQEMQQTLIHSLLLHDTNLLYNWKAEYDTKIHMAKKLHMIKYFGVSIYTNEEFHLALDNENISIIQIPFNLFDQRAITKKWFEKARKKNKLLIIRSVFLQGLLFKNPNELPKNLFEAKEYLYLLEEYTKKFNTSKAELALKFVYTFAFQHAIILFGCNSVKTAKMTLEIYNNLQPFSKEDIKELHNKFKNIDEHIYNPKKWT